MFQRSDGKLGVRLGRTTSWIRRATLKKGGVKVISKVTYQKLDEDGLHYTVNGTQSVLPVDTVVVCAGQTSVIDLVEPLSKAGVTCHIIGGAKLASDLDAKRAIDEGTRVAAAL